MPADADLLCEYYISSALKTKSLNNSFNNANKNSVNDNDSSSSKQFLSTQTTATIDFVKYDKNPMDLLKSKYHLLNNNINTNTNNTTTTAAAAPSPSSSQQSLVQSSASNDLNLLFKNAAWLDLNWSKIRKIGIGLLNLGNNCYLNATLQCLAYTPPLSQWLVAKPHSPSCKFKSVKGFCSLCEVERIIYDIFNSSGNGCAKPNTLCFNIKKISNVFGVGTQEDASEFFTTLLESMAKSIKFAINPSVQNLNGRCSAAPNAPSSNKRTTTILDDIFSFQFRSRITCSSCNRVSDTIENTNTWPVDVKYVQDVHKGMLHFLREEVLDGENAYKCDKCKKKTRATKKYSIRTAPNILVVHLKRFDFSYGGKLSHYVSYPEMLSLKSFIPEQQQQSPETNFNVEKALRNVSYKLYGVLVHLGNTSHSGHYYSYVRGPNDVWYKADDQRINTVQSRDALAQNAYILFYNRILTPNPTNITTTSSSSLNVNGLTTHINEKSLSSSTIIPRQITINGASSLKNIPTLIKEDSTPSSSSSSFSIINSKPVISTTNYLNSLNSASQQSSTSSVGKIIIKFKNPSNNNNNNNIDNKEHDETKVIPIYGPQLPPNLITNNKPEQVIVKKKSEKLINQLLGIVDVKKLKKKLKKFNLKKLRRLKKNIEIDINSSSLEQEEKKKLRKLLLKEKKKKLRLSSSSSPVNVTADVSKTTDKESTSPSLKRKRVAGMGGDSEDNNDNSSLCSLSSLSSSFSSTVSSLSSSGSASSSTDVDAAKKKKKKKKNKLKKLKTSDTNSLALLKQYDSFSSSPSPSPTPIKQTITSNGATSSPTSPSVSSMSSFNSSKEETPTKKEPIVTSSAGVVYSYNASNKLPTLVTTTINDNQNQCESSVSNKANVFEAIRETSSIFSLKKWNDEKSELSKSSSQGKLSNGFNMRSEEEKDIDEYNQEFDMPFERQPKIKFNAYNNKYTNSNNSFHSFTHRANSSNNNNNNNWNNNYKNFNGNNSFHWNKNTNGNHSNYNRNNTWTNNNNNHRNNNNNGNNRFNKYYNDFNKH